MVIFRYGDDAGMLTENTLYAAGNLGVTIYNTNHLGVKAIAKRAAKDTGYAVIEDASGQHIATGSKQRRTEHTAASDEMEDEDDNMEVDSQSDCVKVSNGKSDLH